MIDSEIEGPVGRITLNKPEAHNSINRAAIAEMSTLLEEWARLDELRVLVITGSGKSFCAGASLGDVAGSDWTENPLTALCDRIEEFPVPTICRLNGGAYGGGAELALACDFRVAATGVKAFVPPARLGIHYEPAGIRRAMDRMGPQAARRMFLLAERFEAEDLLSLGFLDFLVQTGELDTKVGELTEILSSLAPLALRGMKRTIVELSRGCLDTEAARARVRGCFASADHAEGMRAQREKRPPVFQGK
ncbi:enoyl-CoA hydratase/isomerase family protein [Amaricoccus macauensis]|uniref:enoyl-CoA hydratase/isomerase family protein n=1 Tax=Amaricoccus macauensis TaxID=57001 RepID=UPI003C7A3FAD